MADSAHLKAEAAELDAKAAAASALFSKHQELLQISADRTSLRSEPAKLRLEIEMLKERHHQREVMNEERVQLQLAQRQAEATLQMHSEEAFFATANVRLEEEERVMADSARLKAEAAEL